MEDFKEILERIKRATKCDNYDELADFLKISRSAIDGWVRRKIIPRKNILEICQQTGKRLEWIMGEEKTEEVHVDGESSKIVEILKEKTNSKNYSELAEKLGMTSSSLSLAKSRGSIGLLLEAAYLYSTKNDIDLLQYLTPSLSHGFPKELIHEGNIAERLRFLRKSEGKTLAEFASLLGTEMRSYIGYEAGDRPPALKTIVAIKHNLNVDLNWLVCGDGEIPTVSKSDSMSMAQAIKSLEARVKVLEENL